jgi:hypothetical protein
MTEQFQRRLGDPALSPDAAFNLDVDELNRQTRRAWESVPQTGRALVRAPRVSRQRELAAVCREMPSRWPVRDDAIGEAGEQDPDGVEYHGDAGDAWMPAPV